MKQRLLVMVLLSAIALSGCDTNPFKQPSRDVPLQDAIVAGKHALVRSSERIVFEEFVKYKELGGTVALYLISDVSLTTSVKTTRSQTGEGGVGLTFPGGGVIMKATNAAGQDQEGKLEIKFVPLGNTPDIYKEIKKIFNAAKGRGGIYKLLAPKEAELKNTSCTAENYCFELRDATGQQVYAYLSDVRQFRELLDKIRQIPPPPKAENAKCPCDGKPARQKEPAPRVGTVR